MRRRSILALTVLLGATALWLGNSSSLAPTPPEDATRLIAHRGVHHIYAGDDRSADTCRAARVAAIDHDLVENTLPSMKAAFEYGADVVELDVHLTPDQVFAVFHDWRLDCQTDGTGVTHEQGFAALRALDIGYGFSTGDGDFPLRGKGLGPMPALAEVFDAELQGQLLVNFKGNRGLEGKHLAGMLSDPDLRAQVFGVYGGGPPTNAAMDGLPGLRGFDRSALLACWRDYLLLGWSGHVPDSCRDRLIAVPMNYAPALWGWPHRFTARMAEAGTTVILWGPYDGSGFSSGIDDAETLARVPARFDGYLWTNRIEVIGPLVTQQRSARP